MLIDEYFNKLAAEIHIKPQNRGKLREHFGVPEGEAIPVSKMKAALPSASPQLRKRIQFALNARKWNN